jgi:hypothetical protein
VPLAKRSPLVVNLACLATAILTCTSQKELLAFDKQTCAAAYETAQHLRNELKLRRAREQLLVCGHSSCPTVVTKDCNSWLTQVDEALASVVFRVRGERGQLLTDVRVLMDGELLRDKIDGSAVMVDPGLHNFRFESDNFAPTEQRQMLPKGERNRPIDVRLKLRSEEASTHTDVAPSEVSKDEPRPAEREVPKPADSGSGPGVGTYVAGGVGLLALSSFAYFGLSGKSDAAHLRDSCAPACSEQDVSAARSKLIAANVSLGVGIVALGVGAVLWAVRDTSSPSKASRSIPGLGLHGLGIDVRPAPLGSGAQLVTTFNAP